MKIIYIIGVLILIAIFFKPNKLCSRIGGIIYINLDNRLDRKKKICQELDKLGCNYTRLKGVYNKNGGLGCVRSHIKCIEFAIKKGYSNIMIFEDDFMFVDTYKNIQKKIVNALKELNGKWDVIMLSGNINKDEPHVVKNLNKVKNIQTASGYIVNKHYYNTLLDNFKESEKNLADGKSYKIWALDQNWKKLQTKSNWYVFNPTLGKQYESYSDIEKQVVNYQI